MAEKDEYVPYGMAPETYKKVKALPAAERKAAMDVYYDALKKHRYVEKMRRRARRGSNPYERAQKVVNKGFEMTFEALVPGYDEIVKAKEASAKAAEAARLRATVTQPTTKSVEAARTRQTEEMERYERKRTASQQEKQAAARRRSARYGRRSLLSPSRLGAPLDQQGKQRTLG